MSITIPKTQGASIEIGASLEKEFGHLPMAFHLFLINHDGAKPKKNVAIVDGKKSAGIERFIPASKIIQVRDSAAGFPGKMLPFARSASGNLVYLNTINGAIYLWDRQAYSADVKLADSFDQFLGALEEVADPRGSGPEFDNVSRSEGVDPKGSGPERVGSRI
jgi:hypothetical protein